MHKLMEETPVAAPPTTTSIKTPAKPHVLTVSTQTTAITSAPPAPFLAQDALVLIPAKLVTKVIPLMMPVVVIFVEMV